MGVVRIDLNKCIGCENCVNICPMDVFYFDYTAHKSVLDYPENCQSCGQYFVNCQGRSLGISNDQYSYPLTAYRGASTAAHESDRNHCPRCSDGVYQGQAANGRLGHDFYGEMDPGRKEGQSITSRDTAILSSFDRYSTFSFGGTTLTFRACDGLEKYT